LLTSSVDSFGNVGTYKIDLDKFYQFFWRNIMQIIKRAQTRLANEAPEISEEEKKNCI
jgi:hypothetical protein